MNISFNLSRIIRFTLAIIMSMVAGYWIGATVDDDYIATTPTKGALRQSCFDS